MMIQSSESQANLGMAALLMPRDPFLAVAGEILLASEDPVFPPLDAQSRTARSLAEVLATGFGTSREAGTDSADDLWLRLELIARDVIRSGVRPDTQRRSPGLLARYAARARSSAAVAP